MAPRARFLAARESQPIGGDRLAPRSAADAHFANASTSQSLLNDGKVRPWQPSVTTRR